MWAPKLTFLNSSVDSVAAVALLLDLDHGSACAVAARDEHPPLAGVDGMRNGNAALPVAVGPQDRSAQRIEAADAAAGGAAPESLGGHDHDQVILATDLDDGRAHIPGSAGQRRRFPLQFTGQLVVRHDGRLRRLRGHDHQIAVDQGVLGQRPSGQLRAAEVLPDVLAPDGLVRARADAVQVSERSGSCRRCCRPRSGCFASPAWSNLPGAS